MEEVLRVRKAVLAPSTRVGYHRAFAHFFMWLLDPPLDEPALANVSHLVNASFLTKVHSNVRCG